MTDEWLGGIEGVCGDRQSRAIVSRPLRMIRGVCRGRQATVSRRGLLVLVLVLVPVLVRLLLS